MDHIENAAGTEFHKLWPSTFRIQELSQFMGYAAYLTI